MTQCDRRFLGDFSFVPRGVHREDTGSIIDGAPSMKRSIEI